MIYKEFYSISWYNTLLEDKEYDLKLNGLIRNLSLKINSSRIIDNKIHLPFRDELEKIINKSNDYGNISFNYYELCSMRNISHDAKLIAFSLHLAFEPLDLYKRLVKKFQLLLQN